MESPSEMIKVCFLQKSKFYTITARDVIKYGWGTKSFPVSLLLVGKEMEAKGYSIVLKEVWEFLEDAAMGTTETAEG